MKELSIICKCGHRLRVHDTEFEICRVLGCACGTFKAETDLEKLRASFHGFNIEAGKLCKAELGTANKTIAWLVDMVGELDAAVQLNAQAVADVGRRLEKEIVNNTDLKLELAAALDRVIALELYKQTIENDEPNLEKYPECEKCSGIMVKRISPKAGWACPFCDHFVAWDKEGGNDDS